MAGTPFPPRSQWGTRYFEFASSAVTTGTPVEFIAGTSGKRMVVVGFQVSDDAAGVAFTMEYNGTTVWSTGTTVVPNLVAKSDDGLFVLPAGEGLDIDIITAATTTTLYLTIQYYLVD